MQAAYLLTRQERRAPRGVPAVSLTWGAADRRAEPWGFERCLCGGADRRAFEPWGFEPCLRGGADRRASNPWGFERCLCGGAEGIRTPDPLHAMEVRYQLRYSP